MKLEDRIQQLKLATSILEGNRPWQFSYGGAWRDPLVVETVETAIINRYPIRIKPTPILIPLEAADIPPGSVFKKAYDSAIYTANCIAEGKIYLADTICFTATYISMVDDWLINRSIPLLGKWDPTAWEPCSKPSWNPG